ncbi:hypothetical protein GGP95_002851 [Salinibacter ruber]|nr:hypothetical protein [Salinibacter ruber]
MISQCAQMTVPRTYALFEKMHCSKKIRWDREVLIH